MSDKKLFKIGQKVKVVASSLSDGSEYSNGLHRIGQVATVVDNYYVGSFPYKIKFNDGRSVSYIASDLEPVSRTIDEAIPGDVIISEWGNKYDVLEPSKFIFHRSKDDGRLYVSEIENLKKLGYMLQQPQDETIQQAIELLTKNGIIRDGKVIEL